MTSPRSRRGRVRTRQSASAPGRGLLAAVALTLVASLAACGGGDGKDDVVAIGDGSVSVALADPTLALTFGAWTTQADAGISATLTLVGDVDGDGKADLFQASNDKSGALKARLVLISNGDGTFHKLLFGGGGKGFDWD